MTVSSSGALGLFLARLLTITDDLFEVSQLGNFISSKRCLLTPLPGCHSEALKVVLTPPIADISLRIRFRVLPPRAGYRHARPITSFAMRTKPVPTSAKLEQVALSAARAAGRIHLRRLSRIRVTRKTNAIDLVTEADRESEQAVIRTLNRAFPDHAILAEESGANARMSEHRWIIDPLDGTTNFAHGFPQFCVSIAYERRGRLELAVVFDALKRELFVAARGRGVRLNARPI